MKQGKSNVVRLHASTLRAVNSICRLINGGDTILNSQPTPNMINSYIAATMAISMSRPEPTLINDVLETLDRPITQTDQVAALPHFGNERYARYALFPLHPDSMIVPCATSNVLSEFDVPFRLPMLAIPLTATTTVDDLPPQHTNGFIYTVEREREHRDFAVTINLRDARSALLGISMREISRAAIDFVHAIHTAYDADVKFGFDSFVVFPCSNEFRCNVKSGRMFPARYLPLLGRFEDHIGPMLERLHSRVIQDVTYLNRYDVMRAIVIANSYAELYNEHAPDRDERHTHARVTLIHKHVVSRGHAINAFYNPVGELAFFSIVNPDGSLAQVSRKMYAALEVMVLTPFGLRSLNPTEESERAAEPLAVVLFERGEFTVLPM